MRWHFMSRRPSSDFDNPDYVGFAQACGAKGYRVETLEEFEAALDDAMALGKPAVIGAHITRLALPHYIASAGGLLKGVGEMIE
ncbi:thiamine pyrophosphate-dependent enzyme, partial [Mesorhizobium sp. M2E.F.Ca.ET.209.01.1.1]|uniref:thiamine pyrophosphate-dependent enzyme n=1 Tax=Mesorhizobium sp. M2E.F.Ca.ET.209.01.1.1 TaxID=2500526 RepID=UPI001FEDED88